MATRTAAPKTTAAKAVPGKKRVKQAPRPDSGATAPKADTAAAPTPPQKTKLVRDSFAFPKSEYALLDAMKERALANQRSVKKTELLRAGLIALNGMSDRAFLKALNAVPTLKTGRPKHGTQGQSDDAS